VFWLTWSSSSRTRYGRTRAVKLGIRSQGLGKTGLMEGEGGGGAMRISLKGLLMGGVILHTMGCRWPR
jgi:hypothetical protein